MKKETKEEIERLLALKSATMEDKQSASNIYTTYVSEYNRFCLTCPASVRILFNQLRVWWNKNDVHYTFITTLKQKQKERNENR